VQLLGGVNGHGGGRLAGAVFLFSCLNGSIEGNRRGSELSRLIHRSMRHTLSLCSIATLYRSRKSISAAAFRPPVFTPLSVSPSGLRAAGYEKTVTGDPGSILDIRNGKATGCSTDGRWQHPALAAALPTPPMSPPFLMRDALLLFCALPSLHFFAISKLNLS